MMAAEQQNEPALKNNEAAPCFYSQNVGLTFRSDDTVATNPAIIKAMGTLGPDDVMMEDGFTSFAVNTHDFAHLMHLTYCNTPEGKKLRVEFDGIFPFDAPDAAGKMQKFNSQLVTLSEVDE